MSETPKLTLKQKLVAVYEKVDHIDKRGTNSVQNYKYVKASDLAHAIRNALQELGVYAEINFTIERTYLIARAEGKQPMQAVDVRAVVIFHDVDSEATLTTSGLGSGADMGDKAIFKAQTGALKYALRNGFLVPDDADPEGDESTDHATTQTTRSAAPAKAAGTGTAAPKPVQAPKAEIPNALPGTSAAPTVATDPPTPGATVAAGSPVVASDGTMPTEPQLVEFRKQFKQLGDDLATAGLKSGRGLPINRKVLAFLLQSTGAPESGKVTLAQWTTFFQQAETIKQSQGGIKALVALVNLANGITEEKKS